MNVSNVCITPYLPDNVDVYYTKVVALTASSEIVIAFDTNCTDVYVYQKSYHGDSSKLTHLLFKDDFVAIVQGVDYRYLEEVGLGSPYNHMYVMFAMKDVKWRDGVIAVSHLNSRDDSPR